MHGARPSGGGNRCGHDPRAPRFFAPPPEHGLRPAILCGWIERVRQFYDDPRKIPSLAHAGFARQAALDPQSAAKPRQMRSERREACCALLGSIMHYCDLPSLCVSVPQPNGSLVPVALKTLAERAGLGLRRAERALRDIVAGGLLASHPRAECRDDGSYVGRAAIRVVPPSVFGLFGLEARLEHERRRIGERRREAAATRTEGARRRTAIAVALDRDRPRTPAAARIADPPAPEPARADIVVAHPEPKHAPHLRALRAILAGTGGACDNGSGYAPRRPESGVPTGQGP